MTTLTLERRLNAPPETVFAYCTKPEHLLKWWGPEGMTLPEYALDFERPGPWMSVMMNADGQRYKVSGEVVRVDPPREVEFTWGWHDEADARGHESTVRLTVTPAGDDAATLTLTHSGLGDENSKEGHESGWTSALRKIERIFN